LPETFQRWLTAPLWEAIAQIIQTYSKAECTNYFAAAGYDAD
jgi:hypothetical protein